MILFKLYSRSYCHLCEDMLLALNKLRAEFEFAVDVIDVDEHSDLVELYDELVPVLISARQGMEPIELCHYFFDEQAVRSFLIDKKT